MVTKVFSINCSGLNQKTGCSGLNQKAKCGKQDVCWSPVGVHNSRPNDISVAVRRLLRVLKCVDFEH